MGKINIKVQARILATVAIALFGSVSFSAVRMESDTVRVFYLGGQSNMDGDGKKLR